MKLSGTTKTKARLGVVLSLPLLALGLALAHTGAESAAGGGDAATPRPELVLQTGHALRVDAIAFSPDGQLVATGSADHTVRLWDAETGRELRRLAGHTAYVRAVVFSPDGRRLASGATDGGVRVWEVATGRLEHTLAGVGGVASLAFSSDGRALAAGTMENTVKLFNVSTGAELGVLAGHKGWVTSVAFGPEGRRLASGARDGSVKLWDLATARETHTLAGHNALVKSLAFSADGQWLASGSFDRTARVWKASDGTEARKLEGFSGKVISVAFGGEGRTLLAAAGDRSARFFDTTTWAQTRALAGIGDVDTGDPPSEVAALSPDLRWLATSNGDKTVQLRDLSVTSGDVGSGQRAFESHSSGVYTTAFSPDKQWFATGGKDRAVRVWEVETGRKVRTLTGHTGWVTSIAFSPDSQWLASASHSGEVKLWSVETGREARTLKGHTESVNAVAFGPDSKLLATASGDATVKLWDVSTGQLVRTFNGHTAEVNAVAYSPDGKTLASAGFDKSVRFWDTASGQLVREIKEQGEIFGVAYSPDGKTLAVAGSNANLYASTGLGEGRTLSGHAGHVRAVSFSADGKQIATGGADGGARLWDAATGRELQNLAGHTDAVNTVAFSPDGRWLTTGGEDGSTRVWESATGALAATLVTMTETTDWLVVAPDGLFDGSPAAWNQIVWRFREDTRSFAPVEWFFNEFFYPDLLSDIFSGKRPRAAEDIAQVDRRQPRITLRLADEQTAPAAPVSSRTVKVRIEVADAPAGARDLRLFRNGSLVFVQRGVLLAGPGRATYEAVVPVVQGDNHLTAYAFNHDNVKSSDAVLLLRGGDQLKRTGTTYIVAVGVNEYANKRYNLKYAVADANSFVDEVRRQRARIEPGGKIEAVTLLNAEATKRNIVAALNRLSGVEEPLPAGAPASLQKLKAAEPEDAVVIYFAGHGTAKAQRFYLIPHDLGHEGERDLKTAFSLQSILSHSISDQELERILEPLSVNQLVLVIDACNSGQALEAEEKRRGPMNSKGLAQLAYEKGMYILTAAQSYQAALEAAQLGHGLLTYALVEEGLKKGEADPPSSRDGQVLVREWFDYAAERVPLMQLERIRKRGIRVAFTGEREVQRPRIFYRREMDLRPLVVARLETTRAGK